jgi:hypothetical protein
MATDAVINIPHYTLAGYNHGDVMSYKWGDKVGSVYVQVTSDGDGVAPIIQIALRAAMADITNGMAMTPEGFTGRIVRDLFAYGWNNVLVSPTRTEETVDYTFTVDFKTQSVRIPGFVHSFTQYVNL